MIETADNSTLERPDQHLIDRFDVWQVRGRTIRRLVAKGFSLAICCKRCPRMIEWTPQDLLDKLNDCLKVALGIS